MRITFHAQGRIKQDVTMVDESVSAQDLQAGLNDGTYMTTIESGETFIEDINGKRIANIDYVSNELEYTDFEVED